MSVSQSNDSQFSATKLWISILEKFYLDMPLARHRRQLRVFHETFTGKDGVDFLYSILPTFCIDRPCSRQMAINLLQLYLNYNYLINARNEEDLEFHDNITLYNFCDEKIEEFIKDRNTNFTKKRVQRASSLRNYSTNTYNKNFICKMYNGLNESANSILQSHNSVLNQSQTERLSMSCNDLRRISQESTKPSTSHLVQSTKKNLKTLYDSVLKSSENVKNSSLNSIRGVSPFIQRISSRSSKPPKMEYLPIFANTTPKHYQKIDVMNPRRCRESVYARKRPRPSSTPPKLMHSFCDRIDLSTFEAQRFSADNDLLKLLDTTIANENMKPAKKNDFLKTFRSTYPRIYSIRFPSEKIESNESNTHEQTIRSKSMISKFYQMIV